MGVGVCVRVSVGARVSERACNRVEWAWECGYEGVTSTRVGTRQPSSLPPQEGLFVYFFSPRPRSFFFSHQF